MRINVFLFLITLLAALFLWTTLSGAACMVGLLLLLSLIIVILGYPDTCILFLLGAREVRSSDEEAFFEAAAQEAYKLAVPMPQLYFYNGTLERAFVLQNRNKVSLVLSKSLLETMRPEELSAVCFELLLQVKKNMAPKRTKVMFLLGLISWMSHSIVGLVLGLIPLKEVRLAGDWFLSYLLYPWLDFLFRLTLGEKYFRKLQGLMHDFPEEDLLLQRVGLKLRKPLQIYSLPSRKLMELSSISKSRHYQNILALEFLPHEWDFIFGHEDLVSAEKT